MTQAQYGGRQEWIGNEWVSGDNRQDGLYVKESEIMLYNPTWTGEFLSKWWVDGIGSVTEQ
ncbi:hypothetical protein GOV07_03250 [Candidatus Woesearchaeota archaeon]|nr:hypothetical protein [Candidatus Woesearchaeota archaeon]